MEMFVPAANLSSAIADFRAFQSDSAPQHNMSVPLYTGVRYTLSTQTGCGFRGILTVFR